MYFCLLWMIVPSLATTRSSWMDVYAASTFGEIPMIPGTHNSAALSPLKALNRLVWPWAQNQSLTLTQQLDLGVRYLDLRVSHQEGVIYCSHRFLSSTTLQSALSQIRTFLERHPSEFVLVFVRADFDNRASLSATLVSEIVNAEIGNILFEPINQNLKFVLDTPVAALRGRVVLFHKSPRRVVIRERIASFDAKVSFGFEQMWHDTLGAGLQKFRDFFDKTKEQAEAIRGIVCDVFNFSTRKGVANVFKAEIQIIEQPTNMRPGVVVFDHCSEQCIRRIFVEQSVRYIHA